MIIVKKNILFGFLRLKSIYYITRTRDSITNRCRLGATTLERAPDPCSPKLKIRLVFQMS